MDYMPFNSVAGDRIYKAEDWAWYFGLFISNGVFANPTNGLQVMANSGMAVNVKPGAGFINGYAFRNTTDASLTLDAGDGTYNRIDRIVLRWDLDNRLMLLAIKKGTAAASPVAPALTRTSSVYELALADIAVARGAVSISQVDITDQRANTALCNFCVGLVDQINWSDLTAQLSAFMAQTEQDLMDYMQYIHDILDSETASHLLNLINGLQSSKVAKAGDTMTGALNVPDAVTTGATPRHLKEAGIIYPGVCSTAAGTAAKVIQLASDLAAATPRPYELKDGALFAIKFENANTATGALTATLQGADDLFDATIHLTLPEYDYDGKYILYRLDEVPESVGTEYDLVPLCNVASELAHGITFISGDGHASYFNGDKAYTLAFRQQAVNIATTDWSSAADANGYYTTTKYLGAAFNGKNPVSIYVRGANNTLPSAAEISAYRLIAKAEIDQQIDAEYITLYATAKPSTAFSIRVEGTYNARG